MIIHTCTASGFSYLSLQIAYIQLVLGEEEFGPEKLRELGISAQIRQHIRLSLFYSIIYYATLTFSSFSNFIEFKCAGSFIN